MNFKAPEEHGLLRDSVRRFFARNLSETQIRTMDRERRIPRDIWKEFGELGWLGLSVPREFGGSDGDAGTSVVMGAILCEELSRQFPSLAMDWVLLSMTARLFREHGSAEQKAEYLPRLARGDFIMAFGMTEPSGGTDILSLTTRAAMEGNQWSVNGQKLFTTFAGEADAIAVLCRTDPIENGKRARGLSLVLTPRHQKGVEVRRLELMGMRAGGTSEVFFDDARAPSDAVVGQRGRGWYHLLSSLDEERILSAAIYVGIAAAALDIAVQYAKDRSAFGRPIGAYQAVQHPLVEVATELAQIRLLTEKAAWLLSQGRDCAGDAAMAKLAASETAVRATDRCMRVLGGYGLVEESALERLFRDARLGPFSPISNEMVKNFLGEKMGLPRSY
ncbi:MAG: acyl-CoA dehydrogenase family protein [Alphaproteobacteria bacterium]|nr:acyl-CoA dehydrogenase family protein [Alphaproteobacteria bacterium]MDP6257223.1 acyl-CoA dehydrogenase family protein [Alphaproteobacteria bacterium]HJM92623.1 acyl-CoA dehydrogenase family protein [Alphaproteobacteria bacterium]